MKKLFLQDGKLMVGEFPEEPTSWGQEDSQYYGCVRDEYHKAVEAAKASAVEVIDPGYEFCRRFLTHNGISAGEGSEQEVTERMGMLRKEELFMIPEGWTVEIEDQFKANDHWFNFKDNPQVDLIDAQQLADEGRTRKIARLIKIEKEGILLEEPQYVDFNKPNIFIDGDFNDSYEARVRRSTGKGKNKIPLKEQSSGIAAVRDKFEVLTRGEWKEVSESHYQYAINNGHYGRINGVDEAGMPKGWEGEKLDLLQHHETIATDSAGVPGSGEHDHDFLLWESDRVYGCECGTILVSNQEYKAVSTPQQAEEEQDMWAEVFAVTLRNGLNEGIVKCMERFAITRKP